MNAHSLLVLPILMPGFLFAGERIAELSVPGMNCPVCPVTVKKSLQSVDGVLDVMVDYAAKTVRVNFDDERTQLDALREATRNAGYPSTLSQRD